MLFSLLNDRSSFVSYSHLYCDRKLERWKKVQHAAQHRAHVKCQGKKEGFALFRDYSYSVGGATIVAPCCGPSRAVVGQSRSGRSTCCIFWPRILKILICSTKNDSLLHLLDILILKVLLVVSIPDWYLGYFVVWVGLFFGGLWMQWWGLHRAMRGTLFRCPNALIGINCLDLCFFGGPHVFWHTQLHRVCILLRIACC